MTDDDKPSRIRRAWNGGRDLINWASDFADRKPLTAYIVLVFTFAFALWRIEGAIEDIRAERVERSQVVASIIKQTCNDNNSQDETLAALVAVSLTRTSFGSTIDPSTLSAFDLSVLNSIARIQKVARADENPLQQVFQRKLRELRDERDCEAIVQSYIDGDQPPAAAIGGQQG